MSGLQCTGEKEAEERWRAFSTTHVTGSVYNGSRGKKRRGDREPEKIDWCLLLSSLSTNGEAKRPACTGTIFTFHLANAAPQFPRSHLFLLESWLLPAGLERDVRTKELLSPNGTSSLTPASFNDDRQHLNCEMCRSQRSNM